MRCASLQQASAVWELLKPRAFAVRDGFALRGPREASVRLNVGVLATVRLRLAPLHRLQQGLGTVHRWADALGLLQITGRCKATVAARRRWSVAVAVTALRIVTLLAAAYLAVQYLVRYGPQQRRFPEWLVEVLVLDTTAAERNVNTSSGNVAAVNVGPTPSARNATEVNVDLVDASVSDRNATRDKNNSADVDLRARSIAAADIVELQDNHWWLGGLYALPYVMLAGLLAYDVFRCPHALRKTPTQVVYERLFGLRGRFYTLKVAFLQFLTVVLQAVGKLKLLSGMVSVAIFLKSDTVLQLKIGFWCFVGLLLLNAVYPGLLMLFSHGSMRLAAAAMDAFLDLGYTVTYLAVVLTPAQSAFGNSSRETDLLISDRLPPPIAFPSDALGFAAVYMSLAHVLAVCRSLERADRDRGAREEEEPIGKFTEGARPWVLAVLAAVSSVCPLLVLGRLWMEVAYPMVQLDDLRCFPCSCEATSNSTLRLVACEIPHMLRYTQLSLSNHSIGDIKPDSLPPSLKVLSLSYNPLRNLSGSLFSQLTSLEVGLMMCEYTEATGIIHESNWMGP